MTKVGRPREGRTSATAVRFTPELHERLTEAARERDMSVNLLVNRAVADFLDRLIPVEEMRWTRDAAPAEDAAPAGDDAPDCGIDERASMASDLRAMYSRMLGTGIVGGETLLAAANMIERGDGT